MAKIPDLPSDERPRERLARLGASAISDAELLAIFLRVGFKGTSAIELGRKLLQKHGSLTDLGGLSVKELSTERGLGPAKAAQLIAAFELGARCANERMRRTPMNSVQAIYDAVAPRLAHERQEHLLIILLDSKLRALRTIELSEGNSNTVLCEPRDVLHHVIINRAAAFIVVHNHPSGDPTPSRSDNGLTRQLKEASVIMRIRFVDHVIIGRPADDQEQAYYSYSQEGEL
ncbi:MAG: RadC family protein [Akkermansiaceae bacterium]